MVRVFLAGIVGGLLMFAVGAATHMGMEAESRHMTRVPDEAAAEEFFKSQNLKPGMYGFPNMAEGLETDAAENARVNEKFKTGPAGTIIVAPTGEDMMGPTQLVGELLSNIVAALLASFVLANSSSRAGFGAKWLLMVSLAPIGWLTLMLSYGLWYRFPMPFILDGLWVSAAEWAVAALAIVPIVHPFSSQRNDGDGIR